MKFFRAPKESRLSFSGYWLVNLEIIMDYGQDALLVVHNDDHWLNGHHRARLMELLAGIAYSESEFIFYAAWLATQFLVRPFAVLDTGKRVVGLAGAAKLSGAYKFQHQIELDERVIKFLKQDGSLKFLFKFYSPIVNSTSKMLPDLTKKSGARITSEKTRRTEGFTTS